MASLLAAEEPEEFPAVALVFFGYPLHAPGNTDRLRDAHLPRVRVPMLFIQGTRDALARLDLLEPVVQRLHPQARLHLVPDGDHSFHVRGTKRGDRETGQAVARIALDCLREIAGGAAPRRG